MRRSEILPLLIASWIGWIGWCTRLTGSSCKENRCAKSEAAKMARNDKDEESCGNGGAGGNVGKQKKGSPPLPNPPVKFPQKSESSTLFPPPPAHPRQKWKP